MRRQKPSSSEACDEKHQIERAGELAQAGKRLAFPDIDPVGDSGVREVPAASSIFCGDRSRVMTVPPVAHAASAADARKSFRVNRAARPFP